MSESRPNVVSGDGTPMAHDSIIPLESLSSPGEIAEESLMDEDDLTRSSTDFSLASESTVQGDDEFAAPFSKKHKKHKHKKHKKKELPSEDPKGKTPLKLTIKFGGLTVGEKRFRVGQDEVAGTSRGKGSRKKVDIEEEEWLNAIEAGKLDEVDSELRSMKDKRFMTARQRALHERKTEGPPPGEDSSTMGSFPEKEMTEEMVQKRAQQAERRRKQEHEKKERTKMETVERLLRKRDSKTVRAIKGSKDKSKFQGPIMTYRSSVHDGASITMPKNMAFPLKPQCPKSAPEARLCGVPGCTNPRKYACSKTGISLCGLECYKKNLLLYKPSESVLVA
ncbi:unnamed protein product [Darwinula stevensoni]|uniref:INO80 complex subunit B-like conserved region domain-containing protein n=1 Tax=Darwinula stevensoni TaxID=69355 RepID=A0A7R9AE85_9CRUS|nr:unnamed protein product [Darwinula stevensoni]CAG0902118.1 unnamed protein product [Darwinula stevensoni]